MALQKLRNRINVKGGGLLQLRQLKPTPSDTFLDVGFLQSTGIEDTHDMILSKDERGFLVDYVSGGEEPVLKCVLKQSGIDEINLIKNAEGIYYEAYYKVKLASGSFQEVDIPLCKIKTGPTLNFAAATERTIDLEIHMLTVVATTSITRNPTGYNMDPNVNPFYVLVENANALGPPADTASAVATLVY